ncbi:MAG: hypothetical protein AAF799_25880 [Myxococcota bacterium]
MGWYEDHIDDKRDEHGDITPPWAKYPTFERYTLGWRMGSGEDWLGYVSLFLEQLGPAAEARRRYLRRHPPAPHTWANWVLKVLGEDGDDDGRIPQSTLDRLEQEGLIAADAALTTYLAQQTEPRWPWTWVETPTEAMRYWTRELAFFSRARQRANPPSPPTSGIPAPWAKFAELVANGGAPSPSLDAGLDAMAQFLAVGWPPAPWALDVPHSSFEDSYDDDMGYADAFRLWLMSTFDDRPTSRAYLATQPAVPEDWQPWLRAELALPGSSPLS